MTSPTPCLLADSWRATTTSLNIAPAALAAHSYVPSDQARHISVFPKFTSPPALSPAVPRLTAAPVAPSIAVLDLQAGGTHHAARSTASTAVSAVQFETLPAATSAAIAARQVGLEKRWKGQCVLEVARLFMSDYTSLHRRTHYYLDSLRDSVSDTRHLSLLAVT